MAVWTWLLKICFYGSKGLPLALPPEIEQTNKLKGLVMLSSELLGKERMCEAAASKWGGF